jgi:hypothetical protein
LLTRFVINLTVALFRMDIIGTKVTTWIEVTIRPLFKIDLLTFDSQFCTGILLQHPLQLHCQNLLPAQRPAALHKVCGKIHFSLIIEL